MIACKSTNVNASLPSSFYQSINILVTKPHVVNKRLWGSKTWFRYFCKSLNNEWKLPVNCKKLENIIIAENLEQIATSVIQELGVQKCEAAHINARNSDIIEIILIELLPKNYTISQAFQLVCINKRESKVTFYNVTPEKLNQNICPGFPYDLQLENNEIVLSANDTTSGSFLWLKNTVLPQLMKWTNETKCNTPKQNVCIESLALVSKSKYYNKYNELKLKYGKEMVKVWPECTDPSKFVYEDVAIATYLLLLWEDTDKSTSAKKQTFVDLGCGNGLLVNILTKEGHNGVGIDVRKRQIWDSYTSDVKLEEKTITPSDGSLFPETDWIIGNHSDELTPWIPVLAAKSSYKCNFFLLPCCAYNFDGTKYQRKNSYKSQYTDYLEYIQHLCQKCGFKTDIDRLKIPSTKRICLVSNGRTYTINEYPEYCKIVEEIIEGDPVSLIENENNSTWINKFKPREAVERVRNCTQLDKNLIESIVERITNYLLEGFFFEFNSQWFAGKTVDICELVQLIPQNDLKQLKSECGGLQTLLKNNYHIFKVQSGKVQLRFPKTVDEVKSGAYKNKNKATNIMIQQKPCWFHNNHPQGCPLNDNNCSFLHVKK